MKAHEAFSDYLSAENILCGIPSGDGRSILDSLMSGIQTGHPYLNTLPALNEIAKRESTCSTVIMPGFALPHARVAGLGEPVAAVACSQEGFSFFSASQKIHVMVLLLSPDDEPDLHLRVIAALANGLSDSECVETLAGMTAAEDVISFFREKGASVPGELSVRDLMKKTDSVLHEKDSLSTARVLLTHGTHSELPVVSTGGCLLGKLSLKELAVSLFSSTADPRAELRNAADTPVGKLMNRKCAHIQESLPAVQLVPFFQQGIETVYATDELERPTGYVDIRTFFSGFFRE